jgi:hypothetical protein
MFRQRPPEEDAGNHAENIADDSARIGNLLRLKTGNTSGEEIPDVITNKLACILAPLAYELGVGVSLNQARHDCGMDIADATKLVASLTPHSLEAKRLLDTALKHGAYVVDQYRSQVRALGAVLCERGKLGETEIKDLLRRVGFPRHVRDDGTHPAHNAVRNLLNTIPAS